MCSFLKKGGGSFFEVPIRAPACTGFSEGCWMFGPNRFKIFSSVLRWAESIAVQASAVGLLGHRSLAKTQGNQSLNVRN